MLKPPPCCAISMNWTTIIKFPPIQLQSFCLAVPWLAYQFSSEETDA